MNASIVRSLLRDAYYQVVDNLGFRILAVLFLLPVIFLLLVGFREDGIWLAHYWRWDYLEWLPTQRLPQGQVMTAADISEVRNAVLNQLVWLVADQFGNVYGFVFGIAAISFFVPQMLERGAADVIFSKPVSRAALFLSRYVAGLIFVGLLSIVLVGGMFVGLWASSDYLDFGLLWTILTLIYGFAIFHAISCAIGVFTRSAIAAILLTVVFMPVNCAMHAWFENNSLALAADAQSVEDGGDPVERTTADKLMQATVDAVHVVLPKSRDAARIARSLRKRLEDAQVEFTDNDLGLTIEAAPEGFRRELRSALDHDGLTWLAPHEGGLGEASWRLRRDELAVVGSRSALAKQYKKELSADPVRTDVSRRTADRFEWREKRGEEDRLRRRWVFQIGDSILQLDYDAEASWAATDSAEHAAQVFLAGIKIIDEKERQAQLGSYESRLGWSAPWRFNAAFSVVTTLLFVVAVLALGWWRLSRIDF